MTYPDSAFIYGKIDVMSSMDVSCDWKVIGLWNYKYLAV